MGIEQTGKLHLIFDTKQVSERFTKREFVLELTDSKYPQMVLFQLTGDRCSQLDNLRVGDEVRVEFSLRGREWKSPSGEVKYFNSLDVWQIEAANGRARQDNRRQDSRGNGRPSASMSPPRDDVPPPGDDDYRRDRGVGSDDLPF